ncbi:MAG: uroporphyrinogen-III C-methyltransferase [Candidatus Omnitrophica bacterium]|nr:uroporphyrinogen-III C-methyltransferase [Candidatus Omnitrophota bacterium]
MSQLRVGSRNSRLATIQVDEVEQLLKDQDISVQFIRTTFLSSGDRDKKTPLTENTKDDFFSDRLDEALLKNEIDIAIHSAKDLPKKLNQNLTIYALTKSPDDTDAFVGHSPIAQLKPGSRIGTSSQLRQEGILQLNKDLIIVPIRGTIEERLKLIDGGQVDGIIVATIALKRLMLENLIKNIMPWDGSPLQGQLAIVGRVSDQKIKKIFDRIDVRKTYGKVSLVGAGPGDPDLITLKGVNSLKKANCVLYDYLVHKSILDHAPAAEKIYVGKRKGEHTLKQADLSRLIRQKAFEGKTIVRLKGGDPLIFGRGADELTYLRDFHIDVDVIPGVSSATGVPSHLGIPLTARGYSSSVAFLSGHQAEDQNDEEEILIPKDIDTLVFLMGLTKLNKIVEALKESKKDLSTPVAVISRGTRYDQMVVKGTLDTIQADVNKVDIHPPALIVVGKIVVFCKDDLKQDIIVYTGTNPEKYQSLGKIIHLPMIEITPVEFDKKQLDQLIHDSVHADIILFTSRFSVQHFLNLDSKIHSILMKKEIIVIGKDTATAVMDFDLFPRHIASDETSQGVLNLFKEHYQLKNKKILFPRSNLPNPFLKEQLEKLGAHVNELAVYINNPSQKAELPEGPVDKIIFTSPSTVRSFLDKYKAIPKHWLICSKGPLTQKTLQDKGYESEIMIYG